MTTDQEFTDLCIRLEHYETPKWAAKEILKRELMTEHVFDPCTGTGIMARAASEAGYDVTTMDIHQWKGGKLNFLGDYLKDHAEDVIRHVEGNTVYMNPPFSIAQQFVDRSLYDFKARKIICFQRFAWWESAERSYFWHKNPPARIWICGSRASCYRHDIPINDKGNRLDPKTGKVMSGSPTAHAFFVWERGHNGTQLGHIYKPDEKNE